MIRILVVLFLLFGFVEGQHSFTDEEVLGLANNIKKLQQTDSLKTEQIETLEQLVGKLEYQAEIDSMLLGHKDTQIRLLKEREEYYLEQIELIEPKWHQQPIVYRLEGALYVLIPALVLNWALN